MFLLLPNGCTEETIAPCSEDTMRLRDEDQGRAVAAEGRSNNKTLESHAVPGRVSSPQCALLSTRFFVFSQSRVVYTTLNEASRR